MCNYKLMARYPDGEEKLLHLQSTLEITDVNAPGAVDLVVRPRQDLSPEGMHSLYRALQRLAPEKRLDDLQSSPDGELWLRRLQEIGAARIDENGNLVLLEGMTLLKSMIDAGCNLFVPVSQYQIGQSDCMATALTLSPEHCQEVTVEGDEFSGLFWFPQEIVPADAVLQTSGHKAQVPLRFHLQNMHSGTWFYSGQILNKRGVQGD